jgi:hypothetical protein
VVPSLSAGRVYNYFYNIRINMLDKLKKLKKTIGSLITQLEDIDYYGPVGYLEEAELNVDNAIEELEEYQNDQEED